MTFDEAQAIHARLDEMNGQLTEICSQVGEILGACGPCQRRVDRLSIAIRGDGSEVGLQREVASLKQSRALARAIMLAAVGVSGSVLGALAQKFWGG
jgi:hypothetical protein